MNDSFLGELWENKAQEERGELNEDRPIRIYLDLKLKAENDKHLKMLFGDVERSSLRYFESIGRLKQRRRDGGDLKYVEESDRRRRQAHKALADNINIFSREFKKSGHDNSWRSEIGESMEAVGAWGERIGSFLMENRKL